MISVGWSELRQAFWQHVNSSDAHSSASHYLLLFYAVECGLKSVYLRRNRLLKTEQINDAQLRGSHDVASWVRELRLPASVAGNIPMFQLRRDQTTWAVAKAHEAWRYGVVIETRDELQLIRWLNNIQQWIKENI